MSELSDDIPTEAKVENTEAECSKPKKRRRGKKKRSSSQDNSKQAVKDALEGKVKNRMENKKHRKLSKLLIRPVDVPKAPKNSTQFIIDDHDECHLYFNFERPNPFNEIRVAGDETSNDAAVQDIDYEYHSMQDEDNSAYYLQDFELSYKNHRYEEITRLTKPDLVDALETMEVRIRELERKLVEKDPNLALEQLQRKLLRLQEENNSLRDTQNHLQEAGSADDDLHNSGSEQFHHSNSEHLDEMSEADSIGSSELFYSSSDELDLNNAESDASNQSSSDFDDDPRLNDETNHFDDDEMQLGHDIVISDSEKVNDFTGVLIEQDSNSEQLNYVNHKQSENFDSNPVNDSCERTREPTIEQSQDLNSKQSRSNDADG